MWGKDPAGTLNGHEEYSPVVLVFRCRSRKKQLSASVGGERTENLLRWVPRLKNSRIVFFLAVWILFTYEKWILGESQMGREIGRY